MIKEEMLFVDSDFKTKDEVIDFISQKAKSCKLITDVELFKQKVFAREEEISTSVGYQVAIPHGKSDVVCEPFIAFVRTKEGFKWDLNSDELVKLIFLIGVPAKDANKLHLKYIAQISKNLINEEFREKLLNLKTKEAVFDLLKSLNK